jgi:tetratricopeptide (TPR) repeat protein
MDARHLKRYIQTAERNFNAKIYDQALFYYSLALQEDPVNTDAKVGVKLCDLAFDMEGEAHALFDYYLISKDSGGTEACETLGKIIDSIDTVVSATSEMMTRPFLEAMEYDNSIAYEDFEKIVKDRENFRRAFEDIMFSTKVIISNPRDFISFVENLVSFGFNDMAINYLESASAMFPSSEKIRELFNKISQNERHEASVTQK